MTKIAYTGLSHYRKISVKELHEAGLDTDVEGVKAIDLIREDHEPRMNPGKKLKHWVEVPEEVAELLLELEPDEWDLLPDDYDGKKKRRAVASETVVEPGENGVSEVTDENTEGEGDASGESSSTTGSVDPSSGAVATVETASPKSRKATARP